MSRFMFSLVILLSACGSDTVPHFEAEGDYVFYEFFRSEVGCSDAFIQGIQQGVRIEGEFPALNSVDRNPGTITMLGETLPILIEGPDTWNNPHLTLDNDGAWTVFEDGTQWRLGDLGADFLRHVPLTSDRDGIRISFSTDNPDCDPVADFDAP